MPTRYSPTCFNSTASVNSFPNVKCVWNVGITTNTRQNWSSSRKYHANLLKIAHWHSLHFQLVYPALIWQQYHFIHGRHLLKLILKLTAKPPGLTAHYTFQASCMNKHKATWAWITCAHWDFCVQLHVSIFASFPCSVICLHSITS